jgi:type II secretory pathway pseudopilin PulG
MLSNSRQSARRRSEGGYILITLILFVALLVIAAGVMAPLISFQVKRDREEELIHRGVQYSRAIKHFVKKFGRYPTRLEELENTNQIRFLRKRYKDPITGKEFKILHMSDVQLGLAGGLAGAAPVNGLNPAAGTPGLPGALGGPNGAANNLALAGGLAAVAGGASGGAMPVPGPNGAGTQNVVAGSPDNPDENGSDQVQPAGANPAQGPGGNQAGPNPPGGLGIATSNGGGAQVFGGGPTVGVASISREKSIRVFNKKDHYYQWQFIYDPNSDRGGLLTTPNQPALAGAGNLNASQPGTPGVAGAPPSGPPGQPSSPLPGQPGMQTPQMPPDQTQP